MDWGENDSLSAVRDKLPVLPQTHLLSLNKLRDDFFAPSQSSYVSASQNSQMFVKDREEEEEEEDDDKTVIVEKEEEEKDKELTAAANLLSLFKPEKQRKRKLGPGDRVPDEMQLKKGRPARFTDQERMERKRELTRKRNEEKKALGVRYRDIFDSLNRKFLSERRKCKLCAYHSSMCKLRAIEPIIYNKKEYGVESFTIYWARNKKDPDEYKEFLLDEEKCHYICNTCYKNLNVKSNITQ